MNHTSEEITFLISKTPKNLGVKIAYLLLAIFLLITVSFFLISYPDSYKGSVTIVSTNPSINLNSPSTGNIKLISNNFDIVKKGNIIAVYNEEIPYQNYIILEKTLKNFSSSNAGIFYSKLPKSINLGDINPTYFEFINSLKQFLMYRNNKLFDKQYYLFLRLSKKQKQELKLQHLKINSSHRTLYLYNRKFLRDSLLFSKKVISKEEFEVAQQNIISLRQNILMSIQDAHRLEEEILKTENKGYETLILKSEKEEELISDIYLSYNKLLNELQQWKKNNTVISPIEGRLQYLTFLKNGQFVKMHEPLFSVVPKTNYVSGQMVVSDFGIGNVKIGQKVVIKLNNFPSQQYGDIEGKISKLSLIGNDIETIKGVEKNYLISLTVENKNKIPLVDGLRGEGEILINNKKLYQRVLERLDNIFSYK